MSQKPRWRQAVESVDARVSERVEQTVHNDNFGIAVGLLLRAKRECAAGVDRLTTAALHAVNLPAKRDFDRVVKQLAALEREVLILAERNGEGHAVRPT